MFENVVTHNVFLYQIQTCLYLKNFTFISTASYILKLKVYKKLKNIFFLIFKPCYSEYFVILFKFKIFLKFWLLYLFKIF